MNKSKLIFWITFLVIEFLLIFYLVLPVLNFKIFSFWQLLFFISIQIFLIFNWKVKIKFSDNGTIDNVNSYLKNSKYFKYILLSMLLIIGITFFTTSKIFHAKSYANLIGTVSAPIDFSEDFDAIDTDTNLPIIDNALASILGDKEFGKHGSLGSEFHVGTFHDLSVNSNLVAVAPLEYNGLFKWLGNKEGTPGYVMVDKYTGEVEIKTDSRLKYTKSAYFSKDLKRHIYLNGENAKNYILTDFALELDDQFNPYYVISALSPTIGFGGKDVKMVYTVNPTNGEIKSYKVNEVPEWVDTVYPENLVIDQLNNWGKYQNGFLNSVFGQKNVIQTTDGSRRVYNDNSVYHYTGLTSIANDEATIGFVFVNTKTKEVSQYSTSGATENAARSSAEGMVQNYGYTATFPIPMNVHNQPTFFITLKDDKMLIKQYAFVNISDFSKVGIGDTISNALIDYSNKLLGNIAINPESDNFETVTGKVVRISDVIISGETYYYILLDDGKIYSARFNLDNFLIVTTIGDEVEILVTDNIVYQFKNNTLDP